MGRGDDGVAGPCVEEQLLTHAELVLATTLELDGVPLLTLGELALNLPCPLKVAALGVSALELALTTLELALLVVILAPLVVVEAAAALEVVYVGQLRGRGLR